MSSDTHHGPVLIRDLNGLRYLARLLAEPGREFHVLDLVAVEQGTLPTAHTDHEEGLDGEGGGGLPAIDEQAVQTGSYSSYELDPRNAVYWQL